MPNFTPWYTDYCLRRNRNPDTDWEQQDMRDAFEAGIVFGLESVSATSDPVVAAEITEQLDAQKPLVAAAKAFANDDSFENMQVLIAMAEKFK